MARCVRAECFGEIVGGVCNSCGTPETGPQQGTGSPAIAEPTPTSMVRPTSVVRPQQPRQAPLSPESTAFAPPVRSDVPQQEAPAPQQPAAPQQPPAPQQAPVPPPWQQPQPPDATTVIRPDQGRGKHERGSESQSRESQGRGSQSRESQSRESQSRGSQGPQSRGSQSRRGSESQSESSSRGSTGSRARGRRGSGTRTSKRMRIGAGLVEVARLPYRDPSSAIMSNPVVAERKRYCGNCGKPVARSEGETRASARGTCPNCGTAYSFLPKLRPSEVVGGQYEVLGCLAYGGLGWIYLAKDRNVSERWVVLKGLIDTGDPSALAAAVAEQQFLAEVEHPNIVKIYNFVRHPDPDTGREVGYIVMEYVGGQSLRELALAHTDESGKTVPLPPAQAIAYALEVLPALGYLHNVGLLYSDLKPDNVLQTHDQLKLIDLGAVRRIDDMTSPIFFTTGYAAPELASDGPSVQSDIYTVGRMLAVLSFDFSGYTKRYQYSLPSPKEVPLFSLFESYYRLLRRSTHQHANNRFASAEEMSDQLVGVLREVLALSSGQERPGRSTQFGPELRTFGSEEMLHGWDGERPAPPEWSDVIAALPVPQSDTSDPAAGLVSSAAGSEPRELLDVLRGAPEDSVEAPLWRARARIELGELYSAAQELAAAEANNVDEDGNQLPPDWRINWNRGLLALASRRPRDARQFFDQVYDLVPGELAPKLALAVSVEYCGDFFAAARLYELVWRTDRNYVSAAFGLARVYLAQGDRSGALDVLESVPDRSSHYVIAQLVAITTRTKASSADRLREADLVAAGQRLERLRIDAERRHRISADVLTAARDWVAAGKPNAGNGAATVLGCALDDRDLRFGLERHYRSLARLAGTAEERIALVDKANAVRPRTRT
ncbi:serine/threonine-protein kinase [Sciscionella sediminilitoris]|uniref:serine/threonine-protein kinase n=1 Tax=Sciscionella sediminilitoris TaxID=1445613 RepID=UPI00055B20A1|nr:serine/threonine-protein kinase [Sciscionella sp. SE31]